MNLVGGDLPCLGRATGSNLFPGVVTGTGANDPSMSVCGRQKYQYGSGGFNSIRL